MPGVRSRGENIRRYILEHVEKSSVDVTKVTAKKFGITRQAVNKLFGDFGPRVFYIDQGTLEASCISLLQYQYGTYLIEPGMTEEAIWMRGVRDALGVLPGNVLSIWYYGFTEMCNNAIDHSEPLTKLLHDKDVYFRQCVGIFKKIQAAIGLLDERHSVLELSKGKLTTDPERHTGEGIFFNPDV